MPRRGVLYVTTGDNYSHPATPTSDAVMALDLKTGRVVWTRQTTPGDVYNSACGGRGPNCPAASGPDFDFGSSAILVRTPGGRDVLVAGQKSGVVYGLDPAKQGEVLWQTRVGAGGTNGGVQWGMASDGRHVYAAVSDVGRQPGGIGGAAAVGNASLHPTAGRRADGVERARRIARRGLRRALRACRRVPAAARRNPRRSP